MIILGGSRYTIMSLDPIDDLQIILNKTLGIESPIRWQKHLKATIPLYNAWHRDNNERVKILAAKKGITLIGMILQSGVRLSDGRCPHAEIGRNHSSK